MWPHTHKIVEKIKAVLEGRDLAGKMLSKESRVRWRLWENKKIILMLKISMHYKNDIL